MEYPHLCTFLLCIYYLVNTLHGFCQTHIVHPYLCDCFVHPIWCISTYMRVFSSSFCFLIIHFLSHRYSPWVLSNPHGTSSLMRLLTCIHCLVSIAYKFCPTHIVHSHLFTFSLYIYYSVVLSKNFIQPTWLILIYVPSHYASIFL